MSSRSRFPELERTRAILAELFEVPAKDIAIERSESPFEFVADVAGHRLVGCFRRTISTAHVSDGCDRATRAARGLGRRAIPLVVVPFATEAVVGTCHDRDVSYLDLAGNARIVGRGLLVRVEGRPNPFPRPGRPVDTFAPRSSRIVVSLLRARDAAWTRRELARDARIDEGRTSRIVSRLFDDGFLEKRAGQSFRVGNRDLLVEAFRAAHPFARESVRRGTIVARSYEALVRSVGDLARDTGTRFAVTGQLAAHLHAGCTGARIVTAYLEAMPSEGALALASFRDDPRAGNVWLVVPRDPDLFDDAITVRGFPVVPPLRAYVDLADHPDPTGAFSSAMRVLA